MKIGFAKITRETLVALTERRRISAAHKARRTMNCDEAVESGQPVVFGYSNYPNMLLGFNSKH